MATSGGPPDRRGQRASGRSAKPGGAGGRDGSGGKGKGPRRSSRAEGDRPPSADAPRSWGSVARHGVNRLKDDDPKSRGGSVEHTSKRPAPFQAERWEQADDVRSEAGRAAARGRVRPGPAKRGAPGNDGAKRRRPRPAGPGSAGDLAERELAGALGQGRAARAAGQLRDAARAFERERFAEARALLRPLAEQAPGSASVRELLGLTYYRLGRWKDAIRELEAFARLTSSTEQHPILADCYRALGRWKRVDELWEELRQASPAADLVAEGRIVLAGSMADRGDVAGAIAVLEKARTSPRRPRPHHLRVTYALADLCERAGDVARARELFNWTAAQDAQFADAAERARALT